MAELTPTRAILIMQLTARVKRSSDDRRNEEPYAECLRGQATDRVSGVTRPVSISARFTFWGPVIQSRRQLCPAPLIFVAVGIGLWITACGCGALGPFGHTLGTFGALGSSRRRGSRPWLG